MDSKLKTQKLLCKIQIFELANAVVLLLISICIAGLICYLEHLRLLIFLLLTMVLGALLFTISYIVWKKTKERIYKKLNTFIFMKLDKNGLQQTLADLKESSVLNITKQNRFLFFVKSSIDNFVFYDIGDRSTAQELKIMHRSNMAILKKKFPAMKNKYLSENHLRLSVQIFVTSEQEPFLENYVLQNKDKLLSIGQFRCIINTTTETAILPSFLPRDMDICSSVFYLKIVKFLDTLSEGKK